MTLKTIGYSIGALLLSAAVGYGFGRYATPAKVESKTAATNELKSTAVAVSHEAEKETRAPVRIVTVTKQVPAKCPTVAGVNAIFVPEVTVTEERGPVVIEKVDDDTTASTLDAKASFVTTKTVTNEQPRLMLQAGTGTKLKPDVGVSYRFAGPVWLGASYDTDTALAVKDRVRLRVSLTF